VRQSNTKGGYCYTESLAEDREVLLIEVWWGRHEEIMPHAVNVAHDTVTRLIEREKEDGRGKGKGRFKKEKKKKNGYKREKLTAVTP